VTQRGAPLEPKDYDALRARWIPCELADEAMLRRVSDAEGAELLGQKNGLSHYGGVLIPYIHPGADYPCTYRVRRDTPEIEHGKPKRKYMGPPGESRLYFVPGTDPALLADSSLPVVIVEGEFKALALWRLARHQSEVPRFLPVAIGGVWNWRGTIGKTTDSTGARVNDDLALITWPGRPVIILFDRDLETKSSVKAARFGLTRELRKRGAVVQWFVWPAEAPEAKGIDDLLAAIGPEKVLRCLEGARPVDWKSELTYNDKGKAHPSLLNATTALRTAPEWAGVLAFNEFSLQAVTLKPTPWGSPPGPWSEQQDRLTTEWLQRHGVMVGPRTAADAALTVANEHRFNPVRDYLDSLKWDGVHRIGQWLHTYLGAEQSGYVAAVGARWLISAVARIYQPGAKVDCCLILEGPQGMRKSTALRTLGEPWFTDHLPPFDSKDAGMCVHGVWIIELAELGNLIRADSEAVKTFISQQSDRIRPPYGRYVEDTPRQCVFAGTVNKDEYLRDETGGRRFWPVVCGEVNIDALLADKDQLWAEAVAQYKAGARWWLDAQELEGAASEEQASRFEGDPWQSQIQDWVEGKDVVTVATVLRSCIQKPLDKWEQRDKNRVARVLQVLGWQRFQVR
jgi:predicted P-loop ATPase